ncbi:MAG: toxin-antitoxin system, antitoxin component [Acinetobacter sp.]|nr:MAG: toxin-antitoxin system, antitoxin component [Acinetobacter sp.]
MNMIRYKQGDLPPLTNERKAKLAALAQLPDESIDFSDISETTAEDWIGAERGRFYRPVKQQLTVRVDADVVAWLKEQGKGYQSRLNKILRQAMLDSKHAH